MVEEVFFRVEAGFFQLSARSSAVPQDLQGKMSSGMSSWKNPPLVQILKNGGILGQQNNQFSEFSIGENGG